jgi:opacity protein-like surface antigen
MNVRTCVAGIGLALISCGAMAQQSDDFKGKNTWTVFTEYSNTSSHILMGAARDRKLVTLGGSYARTLWRSRVGDFSYLAEIRPMVWESDPMQTNNETYIQANPPQMNTIQFTEAVIDPCVAGTYYFTFTNSPPGGGTQTVNETNVVTCGRRWSYAQAFSPIGIRQSFRPGKKIQPFLVGTVGYMYSSVPLPTEEAGSFNFAFDFGAGVEIFRTPRRSISLEYRFHHFSNKNTALQNPGVDNGVFKLSYNFKR